MVGLIKKPWFNWLIQWPDPDIEISGGGGGGGGATKPKEKGGGEGSSRPSDKGVAVSQNNFFGPKIRGGGPLPWIRHCNQVEGEIQKALLVIH